VPIISTIGRKQLKTRALVWSIYMILGAGALTMVYPFMLMIAGSTKSAMDFSEFVPVPKYLIDEDKLYAKYLEGLFNESMEFRDIAYRDSVISFEYETRPEQPNRKFADEWKAFVSEAELPHYVYTIGNVRATYSRTVPQALREFKKELAERFEDDIDLVNRELGTDFVGWNSVYRIPESYLERRNKLSITTFADTFEEFKSRQPLSNRYYFSVEGYFKKQFVKPKYSKEIAKYNTAHGTDYASYGDVHLVRELPQNDQERKDWLDFVRNTLNVLWIRATADAAAPYREFLKAKYQGTGALNKNYRTEYASFGEIPLIQEPPSGGMAASDWVAFIEGWKDPITKQMHMLPADAIRIHSVDFMFRDHLAKKYETTAALNEKLGTGFKTFIDVLPPQRDLHFYEFDSKKSDIRWEFTTRNYKAVVDYMVIHGRGIINTVIYCTLAVLSALLVNPLAAYAMSRFNIPSSYKILLFLMLTMAFPPMVTQIPVFLMLREFNLLNTFAALILPGMANGYAIFLLKGFFDSQPRELYETAQIDGASEWTIFWHITMSLSKPILAVIALQAFTAAYSNFMFALLICQDESMWTLMVWLYELQQRSGPGVIYASLIIAAIPTLVIFIFCQNIIMRGIVVPVEK
jgi:multiple sugar transport system permease protein